MTRTTIIAALAGMLAATPAVGNESMTGNQLHAFCQDSGDFCIGFAAGVIHGLGVAKIHRCEPGGFVTFGQVSDVITKFLRDHPEHRHYPAVAVIAAAINNAWPCEGE